jgi:hypothetical protein
LRENSLINCGSNRGDRKGKEKSIKGNIVKFVKDYMELPPLDASEACIHDFHHM